ncbi:MAG: hypothetical protein QW734_08565 [Candidatus Bathyarchaeia archaeon]
MQLKLINEGYFVIEGNEDVRKIKSGAFVYDIEKLISRLDNCEVWLSGQGIIKVQYGNKVFRNLALFVDYDFDIERQLETLSQLDLLGELTLTKAVFRKVFGARLEDTAGKVLWRPARMEAVRTGTFNNVYKYDINSAYASVLLEKVPTRLLGVKKDDNYKETDIVWAIVDDEDFHPRLGERYYGNWFYAKGLKVGWFFWGEVKDVKHKVMKAIETLEADYSDKVGLLLVYYNFRKYAPRLKTALAALYGYNMVNNDVEIFHVNKGNWKLVRIVGSEFYNILAAWFCAAIRIKLMDFAKQFNATDIIYFGGDSLISLKRAQNREMIGRELGLFKEEFYKKLEVYGLGVLKADGKWIAHRGFNDVANVSQWNFVRYRKEDGSPFSKKELRKGKS